MEPVNEWESTVNDTDWTPKASDKAWYADDTAVVVVRESTTPGIWYVRYAHKDSFGERATFAADREELTPRGAPTDPPEVSVATKTGTLIHSALPGRTRASCGVPRVSPTPQPMAITCQSCKALQ